MEGLGQKEANGVVVISHAARGSCAIRPDEQVYGRHLQ